MLPTQKMIKIKKKNNIMRILYGLYYISNVFSVYKIGCNASLYTHCAPRDSYANANTNF